MKLIPAKIIDGKLHLEEVVTEDVILLNQGVGDSEGQVFITDTHAIYIVNTQPDLQFAIDQLKEICEQLITIGNSEYMTGAEKAVFGTPLAGVASSSESIKQALEEVKLI